MTREAILARLSAQRVLPVLRLADAQTTLDAVGCLHEAGFRVFEVTMTTPDAPALIGALVRKRPDSLIGAGTVVDPASADACLAHGASFLVTPYPVRGIVARCHAAQRPALIGAFAFARSRKARTSSRYFPHPPAGPRTSRRCNRSFPAFACVRPAASTKSGSRPS